MKLIIITTDTFFKGEPEVINLLFENGLERLHIRKPFALQREVKSLIMQIKEEYRPRLAVHDHHELTDTCGITGIHLKFRERYTPKNKQLTISCSCHSFKDIAMSQEYEYVFLSPIYDSISKTGYNRRFTPDELTAARQQNIINERVIALGGVTSERIPEIRSYGFGGVALIGTLWGDVESDGNFDALFQRFEKLKNICKD